MPVVLTVKVDEATVRRIDARAEELARLTRREKPNRSQALREIIGRALADGDPDAAWDVGYSEAFFDAVGQIRRKLLDVLTSVSTEREKRRG